MTERPFLLHREVANLEARLRDRPDLRIVPPVDYDRRPQTDTPLVAFFRRWQFRFFLGCYVIAVATAMYFAFRLGAGR